MPDISAITPHAISLAVTALKPIVSDVYTATKIYAKGIIKENMVNATLKNLRNHVERTRHVKTLWQIDRPVDLLDFYCDSHIIRTLPNEETKLPKIIRKKITSIDDFGTTRSVLVQGIAGQGKSILLRYLCSRELVRATRIPLFIELHRIQSNETLFDHIAKAFSMLGIKNVDRNLITTLCETRKVIFLLDGFDEIPESLRPSVIGEMEELDSIAPGIFVISSRPNSGIEMSTRLNIEKLDNLKHDEYKDVIHKLSDDPSYANSLITHIQRNHGYVRDLLLTPLLVTLLVISYKSYQELPTQLSDFYELIFQLLLQRHDGTKPGFRRTRKCRLNDAQYRQVFDCLCYLTKTTTNRSFTFDTLRNFSEQAILKCNVTADSDDFLKDIIKVTCLILQDGDKRRFIHNSVQEYYAASYVRSRTEDVAKTFYTYCLDEQKQQLFSQELVYLREIDRYRFQKYFILPSMCRILACTPDKIPSSLPKINRHLTIKLIGHIKLGIQTNEEKNTLRVGSLHFSSALFPGNWAVDLFDLNYAPLFSAIQNNIITMDNPEYLEISIENIINLQLMVNEFDSFAETILKKAYTSACEAVAYIQREDACDLMIPDI